MTKVFRVKKEMITVGLRTGIFLLIVLTAGFGRRIDYLTGRNTLYKANKVSHSRSQPDLLNTTVLLNNQSGLVPLTALKNRRIASVNVGASGSATASFFNNMLARYTEIAKFDLSALKHNDLDKFTSVIIRLNADSLYSNRVLSFIRKNIKTKEVLIAGFGQSAALRNLDGLSTPIIWNPLDNEEGAEFSAQMIFGGMAATGNLNYTISEYYQAGAGFHTVASRLRYSASKNADINTTKLSRIDAVVGEAIAQRATPGAVVMVVKDGNVVFNKAYGSHTYEESTPTNTSDIFDIASVTKTAATTMAAMKLYEQRKLDLNAAIGNYLAEVKYTNKANIPVRDVLLHQAGFVNLDFFGGLKSTDRSRDSSTLFPVKLADNYYLRKDYYKDVMWPKMLRTPLPTRGQYVYSDISMYVMKELIEHQSGLSLDKFVSSEFYKPLGMQTAGFIPSRRFSKDRMVPTERDTYFRQTLLHGHVHDSGAAMAGGVSGHAGLFASANDLAILNQMLLNGGSYGGETYFRPETVRLFTSKQSMVSRRGLGFDKGTGRGYPSSLASSETYGHTGYTGTCVWVDPKYNLIYIFLSNRVYPSASNKLNSLRIRPRIHDIIYEAIQGSRPDIASVTD
ncbi:serine hydrolase domain-containing protein [Desertivirga xinjiangensis]|uniref:serine hydrolase domain-containing protein n=1 Tax=Desertivirga xinjiangensis TaxID=539206 RepID=UPI00210AF4B8|nr:serine hydrolase [Pedobacter xinjiangensis]